jgi:hypothetical protein
MKFQSPSARQGNTLIIVLTFCVAIGMVLASILKLTSARYTNSIRSTDWNGAIPVLEAGVEEAMTHLHDDSSISANGWTAVTYSGPLVYQKQRTFSDGSYFVATIYNTNANAPLIFSQGCVRSPLKNSRYISRMVRVTTTNPPTIFTKAMATIGPILMHGGGLVDGFDSRNGRYSAVTNHSAPSDIATDSTASPAVSLGGATINGSVSTGPGGTITGGTITGTTNNDMNVAFPSNSPPTGPFQSLPGSSLVGAVLGVPLGNNSYSASSFTSSGTPLIITGNATLYVSGDFKISGGGSIIVMPGASLKLYAGGDVDIGGGGIVNNPGQAANVSLIGLSSCTSIKYSGSPDFIGTINAPQADLTMSGGSEVFGAIIAKSATFNGGVGLHYDAALAVSGLLVVTGWKEL